MKKELSIRSSAAEFLIFETQAKEDSVEVRYEDNTLWLTQKMMAQLFSVESNTVTYHLQDLFKSGEISENSTTRKFRVVQTEGSREVSREILHYNLEDAGRISAEIAKEKAESEFEMYRVIQDKTFKSDFDLFAEETAKLEEKNK